MAPTVSRRLGLRASPWRPQVNGCTLGRRREESPRHGSWTLSNDLPEVSGKALYALGAASATFVSTCSLYGAPIDCEKQPNACHRVDPSSTTGQGGRRALAGGLGTEEIIAASEGSARSERSSAGTRRARTLPARAR
jgi:hypothetical protein